MNRKLWNFTHIFCKWLLKLHLVTFNFEIEFIIFTLDTFSVIIIFVRKRMSTNKNVNDKRIICFEYHNNSDKRNAFESYICESSYVWEKFKFIINLSVLMPTYFIFFSASNVITYKCIPWVSTPCENYKYFSLITFQ